MSQSQKDDDVQLGPDSTEDSDGDDPQTNLVDKEEAEAGNEEEESEEDGEEPPDDSPDDEAG